MRIRTCSPNARAAADRARYPASLLWLGVLAFALCACSLSPESADALQLPLVDLPPAAQELPVVAPQPTALPRALIFADEFDGDTLDENKWATQLRWGPDNPPEGQYYTPENLELRDGLLYIRADRRALEGYEYASGIVASYDRFTFLYGYAEIRARLPAGQGLWPAFWLTLDEETLVGEIDVFELLGHEPGVLYLTLHFPNRFGKGEDETHVFNGPDYSKEFHTFAVDWTPQGVYWYIDGVKRSQITHDVPNLPMYVLANLAVGHPWPGYPDATTHFPAYYEIDYIRVYQ